MRARRRPRARATCARDVRGGAGAARNDGPRARRATSSSRASTPTACRIPGWLDALLPHFADPEVERGRAADRRAANEGSARPRGERGSGDARRARRGARARRALAAARSRATRREHSPLDRGPAPARVVPYGRVPFVPGAALVVRRHLRFDETLARRGGRGVRVARAVRALRARRAGRARPPHRPARVARPPRLLRAHRRRRSPSATPARRARSTSRPGRRPRGSRCRRAAPVPALAIIGAATALPARQLAAPCPTPDAPRSSSPRLGTLRSGRVVADALTRAWWPLSAAAALTVPDGPRYRSRRRWRPRRPLQIADDLAYGIGLWQGCLEQRTLDPLAAGARVDICVTPSSRRYFAP